MQWRTEGQVDHIEHHEGNRNKEHEESAVHVLDVVGHDGSDSDTIEDADGYIHTAEAVFLEQIFKLAKIVLFDTSDKKEEKERSSDKEKENNKEMSKSKSRLVLVGDRSSNKRIEEDSIEGKRDDIKHNKNSDTLFYECLYCCLTAQDLLIG